MGDMAGQVALVTGGVRGIGLAICKRLEARGVRVAAGYSRDSEALVRFKEAHPEASTHQATSARMRTASASSQRCWISTAGWTSW